MLEESCSGIVIAVLYLAYIYRFANTRLSFKSDLFLGDVNANEFAGRWRENENILFRNVTENLSRVIELYCWNSDPVNISVSFAENNANNTVLKAVMSS